MAPVDTKTNRNAIEAAYKKVCDVNSGIEWAIFGYEGKSNVLKVDATGDGGFEEMTEDLNSGRIQYVYIRVQDPNSDLPKFVFINWQGEGAPDALKGYLIIIINKNQPSREFNHTSILFWFSNFLKLPTSKPIIFM